MFKQILAGLFLATVSLSAHAAEFEEGTHYSVLNREASSSPEVIEFFSYACPGCNSFQTYMTRLEEASDTIEVKYMPVGFGRPDFEATQEMFFVMQAYGKVDELHDDVFRHIHGKNQSIRTKSGARDFLAENGISEEDYEKAAKSFATQVRIKRVDQLTRDMRISSTPTVVVNNRYVVNLRGVTSPDQFARLVKFLATNP
ncbi:MAG: thiol:disulfide interchange protein DsbA/DsbL [Gammaproteobacteria bacterium]|nr:thiol:disulfide interchange protein DsbA/DsbL [Gammaproteobacteria bacterium]